MKEVDGARHFTTSHIDPFQAGVKLIARAWKTVYGSADWKEMKEANPKLAAELAEAAIAEK